MARRSKQVFDQYKIRIGIDPDSEKNGICCYDTIDMTLETCALRFPQTIEYILEKKKQYEGLPILVVVEVGGAMPHNWHLRENFTPGVISQMGSRIGRNYETGVKICEMCEYNGLDVKKIMPIRSSRWGGSEKKIKHDEFVELMRRLGINYTNKRENQDVRDSIMIAVFG